MNKLIIVLTFLSTFAIPNSITPQTIADVNTVHNEISEWRDNPHVKLKLIQKIGDFNSSDDNYLLYQPRDVAKDSKGNIYVLDGGNHRVQKYDSSGKFLFSFGREGQGPSEFLYPVSLSIDKSGYIYVGDRNPKRILLLKDNGKEYSRVSVGSFNPTFRFINSNQLLISSSLPSSSVFTSGNRRYGLAVPGGGPTNKYLLQIFDNNGDLIKELVPFENQSSNPIMNKFKNRIFWTVDKNNDIFIAYEFRNLIEKYDLEDDKLLILNRKKAFGETVALELEQIKSNSVGLRIGNSTPSVVKINSFAKGIDIDHRGRIWVMSFYNQPPADDIFYKNPTEKVLEFEIYRSNGSLLGSIPWDYYVDGLKFRIFDDTLFIIDSSLNMTVFEYKIIDI